MKQGSLELTTDKKGEKIAIVLGRVKDLKSTNISLQKWYVTDKDCENEYGALVTLKLNGDYLYENDFAFSSGSIASINAKIICAAAAQKNQ